MRFSQRMKMIKNLSVQNKGQELPMKLVEKYEKEIEKLKMELASYDIIHGNGKMINRNNINTI